VEVPSFREMVPYFYIGGGMKNASMTYYYPYIRNPILVCMVWALMGIFLSIQIPPK
jgi:hypothetical protein